MTREIADSLPAALAEQGFYRSGERLIAPHGTLWLTRGLLEDEAVFFVLRREAAARLARRRKSYQSAYDWECAREDAECLLAALEMLSLPEPLPLPQPLPLLAGAA
jgi:hypothetical protein